MKCKKLGCCIFLMIFSLFHQFTYAAPAREYDNYDDEDTITVPAKPKDAIGNMLLQSVSLIGIPYRWGGNTPETGMDCSGFIRYLYKNSLGINLPRTSAEMSRIGKRISINKLEPGDLLFFNTRRGANTHVAMYLGDNKMIVAPRTGENIQITELDSYYRKHFNGAKRIVQENEDEDGNITLVNFETTRNEALQGAYSIKKRSKGHSKANYQTKYHRFHNTASKNGMKNNKHKKNKKSKTTVKKKVYDQ